MMVQISDASLTFPAEAEAQEPGFEVRDGRGVSLLLRWAVMGDVGHRHPMFAPKAIRVVVAFGFNT